MSCSSSPTEAVLRFGVVIPGRAVAVDRLERSFLKGCAATLTSFNPNATDPGFDGRMGHLAVNHHDGAAAPVFDEIARSEPHRSTYSAEA